MKNTILIKWNELQQQIDLKNYYMGESVKRKELDADTIQSSKDDKELLLMFASEATNELVTAVALRFPYISWDVEGNYISVSFETNDNSKEHLLPMLKQAMTDYIVNETIMQWLLLRQPQMAQTNISLRGNLYSNVQQLFAKLYNRKKVRRRATDLAGI
ncbi:MAG: hypothetical protein IKJ97_03500 [Bacteroidaceae bacterium]|nr:hypothetical protein [Bacteroidaceae bacterium]